MDDANKIEIVKTGKFQKHVDTTQGNEVVIC
jgi:hypothetical protein